MMHVYLSRPPDITVWFIDISPHVGSAALAPTTPNQGYENGQLNGTTGFIGGITNDVLSLSH